MITLKVIPVNALLSMVFLTSSFAIAQSADATGGVRISVLDQQAQVIPNAVVQYRRIPKTMLVASTRATLREMPASGEAMAGGTAAADQNGKIELQSLPAGNYTLCATVPSAAYLDPCVWQQPLPVTVSANETSSRTVVLTKGAFLNVRVNDPVGVLARVVDGIWTPRKLLVGVVYANGAYQGVPNTNVDATGRDYQLIVPAGTPLALRLFSDDVAIADENGAAVDVSGAQMPFEATMSKNRAFTFTVSGPLKAAAVK